MNQPTSITVSLDMAKKLKEAGWPQGEQIFYFTNAHNIAEYPEDGYELEIGEFHLSGKTFLEWAPVEKLNGHLSFAAPTAEEILRRLPTRIKRFGDKEEFFLKVAPFRTGGGLPRVFFVGYETIPIKDGESVTHMMKFEPREPSLANAAAAMWCYLSDNKLLP